MRLGILGDYMAGSSKSAERKAEVRFSGSTVGQMK
jgi:hypothetical protein